MHDNDSDAFLSRTSRDPDDQGYGEAHPLHCERALAEPHAPGQPHSVLAELDGSYATARRQAILNFERAYVEAVLVRTGGNVTQAARIAQIDRVYLHRLIRRLELPRERFRLLDVL